MIPQFKPGEAVWVKVNSLPWWPAMVVAPEKCPLTSPCKRPVVACVHFVSEDTYQVIYTMQKIHPWEAEWNRTAVKKGLGALQKKPSVKTLFLQSVGMITERCAGKEGCEDMAAKLPPDGPYAGRGLEDICHCSVPCPSEVKLETPDGTELSSALQGSGLPQDSDIAALELNRNTTAWDSMVDQKYKVDQIHGRPKIQGPPKIQGSVSESVSTAEGTIAMPDFTQMVSKQLVPGTGSTEGDSHVSPSVSETEPSKPGVPDMAASASSSKDLSCTNCSRQSRGSQRPPPGGSKEKQAGKRARAKSVDVNKNRTKDTLYSRTCLTPSAKPASKRPKVTGCGSKKGPLNPARCRLPLLTKTTSVPYDVNIDKDDCDESMEQGGSDTDDDLPDVLNTRREAPVIKGDLLWVKVRQFPFWPAVVKNIYTQRKRLKKVTVVFIGEICEESRKSVCLSYNKKRMFLFHQKVLGTMKDQGMMSPYAEHFREAVNKAEDYMMKKCLKKAECPFTFFAEDFAKVTGEETCNLSEDEPSTPTTPTTSDAFIGLTDSETEIEGSVIITTDDDQPPEMSSKLVNIIQTRKDRGQHLINYAKQPQLKEYLRSIYDGRRKCARHDNHQAVSTQKEFHKLRVWGFGPIDDDEQQTEFAELLQCYLKEVSNDPNPNVDYLFNVWIPEAIIWGMMKMDRVSHEKAEQSFLHGVTRMEEEREIQKRELMGTSIDPEYREKMAAVAAQRIVCLGGPT